MKANNTIKAVTLNWKNPSESQNCDEDRNWTSITRTSDPARSTKWVLTSVGFTMLNSTEKIRGAVTRKIIMASVTRIRIGNGRGSCPNLPKIVEILLLPLRFLWIVPIKIKNSKFTKTLFSLKPLKWMNVASNRFLGFQSERMNDEEEESRVEECRIWERFFGNGNYFYKCISFPNWSGLSVFICYSKKWIEK